jgi:uncharacterized membrane protein
MMLKNKNYQNIWGALGILLWVNSLACVLVGVLFEKNAIIHMACVGVLFAFLNSVIFSKATSVHTQKFDELANSAILVTLLVGILQYVFAGLVLLR